MLSIGLTVDGAQLVPEFAIAAQHGRNSTAGEYKEWAAIADPFCVTALVDAAKHETIDESETGGDITSLKCNLNQKHQKGIEKQCSS